MRSMVEGASESPTRSAQRSNKESKPEFNRQRIYFVAADAPSTALRAVPLPRYAALRGGG
jgi:hypothetical protein